MCPQTHPRCENPEWGTTCILTAVLVAWPFEYHIFLWNVFVFLCVVFHLRTICPCIKLSRSLSSSSPYFAFDRLPCIRTKRAREIRQPRVYSIISMTPAIFPTGRAILSSIWRGADFSRHHGPQLIQGQADLHPDQYDDRPLQGIALPRLQDL